VEHLRVSPIVASSGLKISDLLDKNLQGETLWLIMPHDLPTNIRLGC
jgi:hypothetical protein